MKKRGLPVLIALLLLTACEPAQGSNPSEAAATAIPVESSSPSPEATQPPEPVSARDFFFRKLNQEQQGLYKLLEAGDITEDAPLMFEVPVPLDGEEFEMIDGVLALYNALHKVGEWRNGKYFYILDDLDEGENGSVGIIGIQRAEAITPIGSAEEMSAAFDPVFAAWVAQLPGEGASEEEKVRGICDLMCREIEYNYNAVTPGINEGSYTVDRFARSEYGGVVYGTCVCEGYAATFQALAEASGLESVMLSGKTGSGHHAWNLVRVDGQWYHVDVTWMDSDDPVSWLLRSDEEFSTSHWDFNIVGDGYSWNELYHPPAAPCSWYERSECEGDL